MKASLAIVLNLVVFAGAPAFAGLNQPSVRGAVEYTRGQDPNGKGAEALLAAGADGQCPYKTGGNLDNRVISADGAARTKSAAANDGHVIN